MAQKYRKVDPRIWGDEKFAVLRPEEKLIALYCLTSSQVNRVGIFRFSIGLGAEETGTLPPTFAKGFRNVWQGLNWRFHQPTRTLYFPTWWKYNRPDNPNMFSAYLADLHDVPTSPLLVKFCGNICYLPETFASVLRNVTPNVTPNHSPQELDQELDQEQEKEAASVKPAAGGSRRLSFEGSIPENLNTPDFQAVWIKWATHRREIKKPLTPTSTKQQLAELSGWGLSRALAAINYTLAKGWQGIREPDSHGHNGQPLPDEGDPADSFGFVGDDAWMKKNKPNSKPPSPKPAAGTPIAKPEPDGTADTSIPY